MNRLDAVLLMMPQGNNDVTEGRIALVFISKAFCFPAHGL